MEKLTLKEATRRLSSAYLIYVLFASIYILTYYFHKEIFFRDYAIIWEGAYRLLLEQKPWIDFGIPIGPISFLVPLVFFWLFGTSYSVLKLAGMFLSFLGLIVFHRILKKLNTTTYQQSLSLLLFISFHALAIVYPWYNTTALLLLLLIIHQLLDLKNQFFEKNKIGILSILCTLCIFTKQDYGILSILLSISYMIFFSRRSLPMFLFLVILCLGLIFISYLDTPFYYWFNMGQPPHGSRSRLIQWNPIHMPIYIFSLATGSAFAFFTFLLKRKKNIWDKQLFIISGVLAFNFIVVQTSGLPWSTGYFGLPFLFLLATKFIIPIQENKYSKSLKLFILIITLALISKSQTIKNWTGWLDHQKIPDFSGHQLPSEPWKRVMKGTLSPMEGTYLPIETITMFEVLKSRFPLASLNTSLPNSNHCNLINMTELTPIYALLESPPCIGLPLWYDTNYIFFDQEIQKIKQMIQKREPHTILIQWTHQGKNHIYDELINLSKENYTLIGLFKAPREDAPIFYFEHQSR